MHLFAKIHCIIFSICTNYAATNKHYRAFCFSESSNGRSDIAFSRFIFHNRRKSTFYIINQCGLHITRYVNEDRARTSGLCHLESKTQGLCQRFRVFNEEVMFGNRHCNTSNVYFLESIATNHNFGNLACNRNNRNRIQESGCQASNQVSCTRSGSCNANANFTRRTSIAICSVCTTLFVSN